MQVSITCASNSKVELESVVHSLSFDVALKTFFMPCPKGDNWLHRIACPLDAAPVSISFQWDKAFVSFEHRRDVEAFSAWLAEAKIEAEHGYNTMRG